LSFACFWIARTLLGVLVWGALIAITLVPLHRVIAHIVMAAGYTIITSWLSEEAQRTQTAE
jgi:hypothetical protein